MCGRYTSTTPIADLAVYFHVDEVNIDEEPPPSWNVAPTRDVVAVTTTKDGDVRRLQIMKWGLVPAWAKDPAIGSRMMNARAETLATSNAYRKAFATRRCILPADGYYEWLDAQKASPKKTPKRPFYYSSPDGDPLAIGGLWEVWHDAQDGRLHTCTIVTTGPNELAAKVHDRMPLLLPPAAWDRWLAPEPLSEGEAATLLVPAPEDAIAAREVTTAVSNVRNDGPELLEAASAS
jgi:putative SOS response-associated peptidase YedK